MLRTSNVRLPPSSLFQAERKSKTEVDDAKDEKAILKLMKSTLPQFCNETDWELTIFELKLILARVWPHKDDMDIIEYMTSAIPYGTYTKDMEIRADNLIYYALTTSAKKGSYAKLQIVAACHHDAVPCVLVNEGKKLFQMFQGLFTMTNLHKASLPTIRAAFHSIKQHEKESILAYTSRVDIIVATLAKLGEKVSTGLWIFALGNGLRQEYKKCKDGILYNEKGFDNILSVKNRLISEEAVLLSQNQQHHLNEKATKVSEDEIALKLKETKLTKKQTKDVAKEAKDKEAKDKAADDTALVFIKGKGGKGTPRGRDTSWDAWNSNDPLWNQLWTQPWTPPAKGKGKGKSQHQAATSFDPQGLWCDIHQKFGHSTDWCFDNPNRTGGKPTPATRPWCDACNSYGHTSATCWANPPGPPKGKGK